MKKTLLFLVLFSLLLPMAAGCGGEPSPEPDELLPLVFADASGGIQVTRPDLARTDSPTVLAAMALRSALETATGITQLIKTDYLYPGDVIPEKEFLIGITERTDTSLCPEELTANDYFIGISGNKIMIYGGSDSATYAGVTYFIDTYITGKTQWEVPADLSYVYHSEISTYNICDIMDRIKIHGRYSIQGTGIGCDFSACGIEFTANCQGDVTVQVKALNTDVYFAVFVDGERQTERPSVKKGETAELTAAKDLTPGEHTIRFIKDSESRQSSTLLAISLCGELLDPPEPSDIFLEFVGDSITCGYGIGNPDYAKVDIRHYGASLSYGYLCADLLDADYSIVSVAGYAAGGKDSIPGQIWKYTCFRRDVKPRHDFARVPSALIINLGTNDSGGGDTGITESAFYTAMTNFIETARTDYNAPDMPIVFVYDMMRDGYQSTLLRIVREQGGADGNIYAYAGVRNNTIGGHPNAAAHKKTAEGLAQFLQNKVLN